MRKGTRSSTTVAALARRIKAPPRRPLPLGREHARRDEHCPQVQLVRIFYNFLTIFLVFYFMENLILKNKRHDF